MGSTGRLGASPWKDGKQNSDTFGIGGAVNFSGKLPANTNLEPPGSNKITLKVNSGDKKDIFFQFKLSKDEKYMTIIGHDPNSPPVKAKVQVDSGSPSLSNVHEGTRLAVTKLRNMMNKSTEISEDQLGMIANKLMRKRNG